MIGVITTSFYSISLLLSSIYNWVHYNSFVTDRTGNHNEVSNGNILFEHTTTTAGDEFTTTQSNYFFEQACCQRCTNARMKESQAMILI
jgi:hypothetical protein